MILCAVDQTDLAPRVLHHAVGFAGALGAPLTVLHVGDPRSDAEREIQQTLHKVVPYGATYLGDPLIRVQAGDPADVIRSLADELDAALIVTGTRGRTGLARLLLGSTSADLLTRTTRPVLLIPPSDIDIVTLGNDRVGVHFGAVIAAIDLTEANAPQMAWAVKMAKIARQPLCLLTVTGDTGLSDRDAAAALKERGHGLGLSERLAFIVRRGDVAQEIARAAVAEQSGLVVMGLRVSGRGSSPGRIASEVLQTGRTLVLAVPAL
ncbi:MAG: universal stress protein [Acidobacteriota bacterium]